MTDSPNKIDAALQLLGENEEALLLNAMSRATTAYKETPNSATLKEFAAAKQALEDYQARKNAVVNPDEQRFGNLLEALSYIRSEGWKCSKSKLYEDQGKIERQKDGNFLRRDIDKYAENFLKKIDASDGDTNDSQELQKWEIAIAEEKHKKLQRENEVQSGLYLRKTDVEHMLAARAAFLKDNLGPTFIHSRASGLITLVKGDPDRAPEFIDAWTKHIDEMFDLYSKPFQFEAAYIPKVEDDLAIEEAVKE